MRVLSECLNRASALTTERQLLHKAQVNGMLLNERKTTSLARSLSSKTGGYKTRFVTVALSPSEYSKVERAADRRTISFFLRDLINTLP